MIARNNGTCWQYFRLLAILTLCWWQKLTACIICHTIFFVRGSGTLKNKKNWFEWRHVKHSVINAGFEKKFNSVVKLIVFIANSQKYWPCIICTFKVYTHTHARTHALTHTHTHTHEIHTAIHTICAYWLSLRAWSIRNPNVGFDVGFTGTKWSIW